MPRMSNKALGDWLAQYEGHGVYSADILDELPKADRDRVPTSTVKATADRMAADPRGGYVDGGDPN
jgi:hypothetical protein